MREALEADGGDWIIRILAEPRLWYSESNFYIACTTSPTPSVVHAGVANTKCHPLCKWMKGAATESATGQMGWAEGSVELLDTPQLAKSLSSTFCQPCYDRLSDP